MADVLLTHSYHLFFDRKQIRKMKPYPPLGTLYAAALLRAHGISVALFDSMLENPDTEFPAALARHQPRIVVLYEDNFNFLTKMCLTRMREVAFSILDEAQGAKALTIVNGSDATDHAAEYLQRGFDYMLLGEAEWTLLELVTQLLREEDQVPDAVSGIAYLDRRSQEPLRTQPRKLMPDLDRLPFPAWDLIDGERYRGAWTEAHGFFSLNMVSSRGCPYQCNWCAKPIYGTSYNARSPESVAQEMLFLKKTFQPDHIWFADDIFALKPHWTERFSQAVQKFDAAIPFQMQSRVDLMNRTTVRSLAAAGCTEVWMGAESGSQRILDAMDKGSRIDDIFSARQNLRSAGIRACFFLQFGYPGETWKDIQLTIDLVRQAQPDDIGISVSYPLPGTKFYSMVQGELKSKTNWEDSEDLAMMFRGTYTAEFYRALHDTLHLEVELTNIVLHNGGPPMRESSQQKFEDRLKELMNLWLLVGQLESRCRNAKPTRMQEAQQRQSTLKAAIS